MTDQRKLELTLWDQGAYGVIMQSEKGLNYYLSGSDGIVRGEDYLHSISIGRVLNKNNQQYKPILFDLSSLTEEITIEGETFVPTDYLHEEFSHHLGEDSHYEDVILFYIKEEIDLLDMLPFYVIDKLNQWKFNIRGLSPDQFIDVKSLDVNPYE